MKLTTVFSIAALVGVATATPVPAPGGHGGYSQGRDSKGKGSTPTNELHQYSVIAALTAGVASRGTLLKNVMSQGNLGLGTWDSLAGEMIVVDGVAYRATANQTIERPDPQTVETPFAAVTNFKAESRARAAVANFSDFTAQLPTWFADGVSVANHFVAYRLDGTFHVRVRAPPGQSYPLEPLASVTARQVEWEYDKIAGTMVGFRTPQYAAAINAAGDHLHFISKDRQKGGHVLAFRSIGALDIQLARVTKYHVEVPAAGEFEQVAL